MLDVVELQEDATAIAPEIAQPAMEQLVQLRLAWGRHSIEGDERQERLAGQCEHDRVHPHRQVGGDQGTCETVLHTQGSPINYWRA